MDKKNILIIDDAPENIDILSGLLNGKYNLKIALSGKRGLEIFRENDLDLIFLDIMMPDMDGYEVCRQISLEKGKQVPVIFLSAEQMETVETQDDISAVVDFIAKPINPVELQKKLKIHFGKG